MANVFYAPGDQRASKVNDLFAGIATRYDLINDLQSFGLHRRWKRKLVQLANPKAGDRALDLCCGTGDIVFALARRGAEGVGLDFSQPMLEIAKSKIPSAKSQVEFVQGDAQKIPFPENSFEIVTVGYGLRNLASWEAGLREMLRVAKHGGRLLVLEFGKPNNPFLRAIYFGYLRFVVPMFGRIFCGNAAAYAYILESLKHYPAQYGVADKMRELGLRNVCVVNLLWGAMSINYAEKA